MPFQLSPGVNVTEIDLTGIVPAVASTDGAIAGIFAWGPVGTRQLIDTETKLVNTFGKPSSNNAETWFTAANFLSYTNRLYVTRAANTSAITFDDPDYLKDANATLSAVATFSGDAVANLVQVQSTIENDNAYLAMDGDFDADVAYVARYPGAYGNSLKISVCDSADAFTSLIVNNPTSANVEVTWDIMIGSNTANVVATPIGSGSATDANTYAHGIFDGFTVGDFVTVGNSSIGTQYLKISSIDAVAEDGTSRYLVLHFEENYRLHSDFTANASVNATVSRHWEYFNVIDSAPTQTEYQSQFGANVNDGLHVVISDEMGVFTGVPGTILESYRELSRSTDAKTTGGAANYYKTVINNTSKYVWLANDRSGSESNTAINLAESTNMVPMTIMFQGGQDGFTESNAPLSVIATGYDQYASAEDIDISLILQGKPIGGSTSMGGQTVSNFQLANYIIDNIVEVRKDCIVLISPDDSLVSSNVGNQAQSVVNWRNAVHDSSYAVIDSGYKYQYDRYNDVYRWIPANGDIAGLCARTDNNRDPWWSPAGFNRGQLKNLLKLRWNPSKADRDILYKNGVNPLVTFPGQGTVMFGDKTLQSKPSAFDRINVRRLFIVLEKAIATASKFFLFEFNDEFTRAQFKNLVTPYLRDVQGRRGITDFLVVCDGTNNTPERIDRNEFWGDIYIKPARSINFIQLNFVAVRSGVQFSEIVGKF